MAEPGAGEGDAGTGRPRVLPGLAVTVAVGALVVALVVALGSDGDTGSQGSTTTATTTPADATSSAPTFGFDGETYAYPTPAPESDEPLGVPAVLQRGGTFAFARTQPDDDTAPVAWDPCRTIHVVVSVAREPAGAEGIVEAALAEVASVTGIPVEVEGPTDEPVAVPRPPVQPDRYGDRWAPVLVAWTDAGAAPDLEGDTGGLGGAIAVAPPGGGPEVYVTGQLLLDADQLGASLAVDGGRDQVRSAVLHELGHLMGLAHVDDAGQMMYPEGRRGGADLAAGDLAGLVELGKGPCVPTV